MLTVAAFYQFKDNPTYEEMQPDFLTFCKKHGIKGTILLAREGINGTVAGSRSAIDNLQNFFQEKGFNALEYKESHANVMPFLRLKVRLKNEIVTLGQDGVSPTCMVGQYVEPKDWNALITHENTITIDTRNDYEYLIGTFKGAINPNTTSFREFPKYIEEHHSHHKDKAIAMFCTGGIRCEKSTSLLLSMGFKEVYHLKGGILKYLEEIPKEESLWQGECFVFDDRVAVTHGLALGTHSECYGCRMPLSQEDIKSPHYEEGVKCHHCYNTRNESHYMRVRERQRQMVIAKKRGRAHIGSKSDVRPNQKEQKLTHAA